MIKQANLAKLSRPNLFGVVARERLFTILEEKRNSHPVVWIKGPPGAGKTALVTSFLEERRLPALWYQVDGGDHDLSTFFYFMRLAGLQASNNKNLQLPILTPEYLPDLPEFFRRFFRKFFAAISDSPILVLDNYQEVGSTSAFHDAIQAAIEDLPMGINLFVISHHETPPHFARLLACNLIGEIDWGDLRLTSMECKAIIKASGLHHLDESTLSVLQDQTNGWAAGLVLMLERFKQDGAINQFSRAEETEESIFHFFAQQIFDKVPENMQRIMLYTALLPDFTEKMAQAISGNKQAPEFLNLLYRRRLFIDRRTGNEISYQYHGLFRNFLLYRANNYFSQSELCHIKRSAASIAEQNGRFKEAAELFAEAEEWVLLVGLIFRQAATLITQGRNVTLQKLIDFIPFEMANNIAWLLYWRGSSHLMIDARQAAADFEQAYRIFERESDHTGLFLTCGSIMDAYMLAEDDMTPILAWAKRLQDLLTRCNGFPSLDIEAKVLASMTGLIYAAPHHPLLEMLEKRAEIVFEIAPDPFSRFGIACAFIWLPLWRGEIYKARKIIEETNFLISAMPLPPAATIHWLVIEAAYAWSTSASHQLAEIKIRKGLEIAQEAGITILNCVQWGNIVYSALAAGNLAAAKLYLEKVEATLVVQGKHTLAEFKFLRAGVQLIEGNLSSAYDDAVSALKLHEKLRRPFLTEGARFGLAQILIEKGEFETAHYHLDRVIQYSRLMKSTFLEHQCLLIEAYSWLMQEAEEKAMVPLKEGLRVARENDYIVLNTWWRPQVIAQLFSLALEAGIEESYVQGVIRRRNLKANSTAPFNWPWDIKIFTLGRFEVWYENKPLRSSGKTQHKPLELLKFLCSHGRQAVSQDSITDALWPDSEGDSAEQALRTTLHRLRKLLQNDQALRLENHKLSLDPDYVWVDCMAFDRLAHHADISDRTSMQCALSWYQGHFLQGESMSWALALRDRLRVDYQRLVVQYGALLEHENDWESAVNCYQKAIEVEPTIEIFYYRIMNSYLQLDRRAEALATYQRCRKTLLTRMGISPAKNTQALYETLINSKT